MQGLEASRVNGSLRLYDVGVHAVPRPRAPPPDAARPRLHDSIRERARPPRDIVVDASHGLTVGERPSSSEAVISMGDKSPKAKDKNKKQHTAGKDQKQAAAAQKAKPASPGGSKKGN
jgi:hypothetical protein